MFASNASTFVLLAVHLDDGTASLLSETSAVASSLVSAAASHCCCVLGNTTLFDCTSTAETSLNLAFLVGAFSYFSCTASACFSRWFWSAFLECIFVAAVSLPFHLYANLAASWLLGELSAFALASSDVSSSATCCSSACRNSTSVDSSCSAVASLVYSLTHALQLVTLCTSSGDTHALANCVLASSLAPSDVSSSAVAL